MSEAGYARILAFDCSGGACSAAVWADGRIVAERFAAMDRGQSETLLPQIREVMAAAGLGFDRIDALATVVGPGSFTGLRIGLAAARGLALASGKPILAMTAFEAFLAGIPPEEAAGQPVAIAIDSRRGPVFAQLFGSDRLPVAAAAQIEADRVGAWLPSGPVVLAGDGAAPFLALARPDLSILGGHERIRAAAVARAAAALGPGSIGRLAPVPLYLRAPDVTLPKPGAR